MSILLGLLYVVTQANGRHPLSVADLRCESVTNPVNVDVRQPRLSWLVSSPDDGQRQSGYQILAATTHEKLAAAKPDLWDTGKLASNATLDIPYQGKALRSTQDVFWKVRVWDAHGRPSTWSAENRWTMGLLDPSDWKSQWIGADETAKKPVTLLLRKNFSLSKPVKRALCFVTGLGQYQLWVNGHLAGDPNEWLKPGWTQYAKTVLCDSVDVAPQLLAGPNAIAMHLGNGMYDMSGDSRGGQQQESLGHKKALCQIRIEFVDGTSETIGTDDTWRWAAGPETYSGVFGGDDYDSRLEPDGWLAPGFDDQGWQHTQVVAGPGGILRGLTHAAPPFIVAARKRPISLRHPKPNILVCDMGQNAPYVPIVSVQGKPGFRVKMSPAEILKPDGLVDQQTMRPGKYASYILGDSSPELPSFWYCGSRYWQIEVFDPQGMPVKPDPYIKGFQADLVHADIKPAGSFECSNLLFNQTHELIRWAMISNFASVISDCPHREKSGWLEQDHLMGAGLMYCFDMRTMFRKVIQDMRDTQQPNGMVPTMAPEFFHYDGGFRDSVEWGGAYLLLPEMVQSWYGNHGLVAQHFDGMKRYVDYLTTCAKDGILSNGLGDWNGGGADPRTPVAITDTAYYFEMAETLAKFSATLGKSADAARYHSLADSIRRQFNARFVDSATGKVGSGSQSGQATALDFGLIDHSLEPQAFERLMEDVEKNGYGVSCGEVGHPALLRVLTKFGRADVVARIHLQTEKPGYGYQIKKGMTTLAESWAAGPNSLNHFMLGHIMEWFYGDLVGIKPDPSGIAFSRTFIQPRPVPGVTWAKASYNSVRGTIACSWKENGDRFHLEVTIPANTTATVYVPSKPNSPVRLTNPSTKGFTMFVNQRSQDGYAPIPVTAGRYVFDSFTR